MKRNTRICVRGDLFNVSGHTLQMITELKVDSFFQIAFSSKRLLRRFIFLARRSGASLADIKTILEEARHTPEDMIPILTKHMEKK